MGSPERGGHRAIPIAYAIGLPDGGTSGDGAWAAPSGAATVRSPSLTRLGFLTEERPATGHGRSSQAVLSRPNPREQGFIAGGLLAAMGLRWLAEPEPRGGDLLSAGAA